MAEQHLNKARVIVLGEGGVGKTSLIKQLRGETFDPKESTIHSIRIGDWIINQKGSAVKVHFWDFGGQEIYYATYQLFLAEHCLYLIVLDGRRDENAEYWLNLVQIFGGDAPTLLVLNKIDQNPGFDVDRKMLKERFPFIQGFFKTSYATEEGFPALSEAVRLQIANLEMVTTPWPQSWLNIEKELAALTQPYLEQDIFRELCNRHGVSDIEAQSALAMRLHNLGQLLHFDDFGLQHIYIANPIWLTHGLFAVLRNSALVNSGGILHQDQLRDVFAEAEPDVNWPASLQGFLINLMIKFELCVQINEKQYLFPNALTFEQPEFPAFDDKQPLHYRLRYSVLPTSIISNLIVKRYDEVMIQSLWRFGMLLSSKKFQSQAVIVSFQEDRQLRVGLYGGQKDHFLASIRDTLETIHRNFQRNKITEEISCHCSVCKPDPSPEFYQLDILINQYLRQLGEQLCPRSFEVLDIPTLIRSVSPALFEQLKMFREQLLTAVSTNDQNALQQLETSQAFLGFHLRVDLQRIAAFLEKQRPSMVRRLGYHATVAPPQTTLPRVKHLPTNSYNFAKIRDPGANLLYIDKTALIYRLINEDPYYFLARPRRFGKSLLISTLKELFLGNRQLFEGLAIAETGYGFPVHPVIHLDVTTQRFETREDFENFLVRRLRDLVTTNGWSFELEHNTPRECFGELIQKLSHKGAVVILIDEYDKPILDSIDHFDAAQMIRDVLQEFYSVIKEHDAKLRFVMVTGVSKFSKVSLFSGLNNLTDISLNRDYATLLGITQQELETSLATHIQIMAEELDLNQTLLKSLLKKWYNGYRFTDSDVCVYNPVSLMRALKERTFDNYWFQTATPSVLIQKIKRNKHFSIEDVTRNYLSSIAFDTFDIESLDITSLMLQTGYLTIGDVKGKIEREYRLDYPNYEVKKSLFTYLLESFSHLGRGLSASPVNALVQALNQLDTKAFESTLQEQFIARIPYELHIPEEKYYQSMFHILCVMMGMEIRAEESTNFGRMDAVIVTSKKVFIIEMKYEKPVGDALQQIKDKQYYQRYLNMAQSVILVGISFFKDRHIEAVIEPLTEG